MNKNEIHKTREDNQISIFIATKSAAWDFVSSRVFQILFSCLLLAGALYIEVLPAESRDPRELTFGEQQTTNIFPTSAYTDDWGAVETVLTQDLSDHALYQDFDKNNSAHIKTPAQSSNEGDTTTQNETDPSNANTGEVTAPSDESEIEEDDLPTEEADPGASLEEVEVSEPEPTTEPVSLWYHFPLVDEVVIKTANSLYPLAQLSVTSSTEEISDATPATDFAEAIERDSSATNSGTPSQDIGLKADDQTITIDELNTQDAGDTQQITLENFSAGRLEPGHFVDTMQLRLSFAAQPKEDLNSGTAPYVDVFFGTDEAMRPVGVIILDEEVSNAINGGYYLFALPSFIALDELNAAKIIVRYHGSKSQVENVFLDAAWLEMTTRSITKEDLHERGLAEQLTFLDAPDKSVLLSDQLNFDIADEPVFNLRYESQQNFLMRGFLKLIGKGSFGVNSAVIIHDTLGEVNVDPELTVGEAGLVTIKIPESENEKMPPGTYTISITFDENGYEYTDTFDFQWGVLAINPHKSEYEVNETANISIGALSPNGNTLCDANLQLYITDPAGYVSKAPVAQSGQCNGNNVIDVPDFSAEVSVTMAGDHELYLERLDEQGNLIGFTTDTFKAVDNQVFSIERNGPTRIYPVAPYEMELTVHTDDSFEGVLKERVPATFVISSTSAAITKEGDWQILSWDVTTAGAGTDTVSYGFDAPDISPFIYELGSAWLEAGGSQVVVEEAVDTNTASGTVEVTASSSEFVTNAEVTTQQDSSPAAVVFAEHRKWQVASDATGSMLLMWAGANIPSGWTCVSCTGSDAFYQRFIVGSSTAGNNGGAATHTHTATGAVAATTNTVSLGTGGVTNYASVAHTHAYTPTIGTANNLPAYRNLVIIQNNSAGEPTSIPTGAIVLFDAAVPSGWTRYSAQDGSYVRGESAANRGVTGGSNTHTHTITGSLAASAGAVSNNNAGATSIANNGHTHTVSSNTASASLEPPYIQAILGQLNATTTMPDNAIAMWTDSQPSGWTNVSTTSAAFNNRFFKPAATYGTTGGTNTHTPANVTGITSSGGSAGTARGGAGNTRPTTAHTHSVDATTFTSGSLLPQYRSAIFAKRAGGSPPNAPTVHELFDHEKTGTSTPEFEFTANDPYGTDTLVYQFQWDDDSDLDTLPSGDRTSDVETGCSPNCFINTVTGGDTNPFNEAERIRFTIQSPLTNGTTYYFRVRAKKTIGGTYGSWSETYSFTYVVDTDPSQWMQTQDAQFAKNVFSSTETFGSDNVRIQRTVPSEVLTVYGEGAVTTPRYRIWNGTAWGAEASASDVGGVVQWVKTAAGTTRDEYVMATQDAVNDVNVQVFNGTTDTWSSVTEVTTIISDNTRRGVDVAYETTSGDAMIVYCDGDSDPSYRIWNGSSWSSANTITTVSANNCDYIELASDPISDEVILVTRDTGAGYEAQVWNGSAWGSPTTLGSMSDTAHEGVSVEYEESGGQGMVVVSNGNTNGFIWTSWNGTEWGTATAYTLGDDFEWGVLKRDNGSDNMALCYIDNDADIGVIRWDGDAWQTTFTEIETTGNIFDGRAVSCEFETSTGRDGYIMVPYSDTTNLRYQFWNGISYSTEASISTILEIGRASCRERVWR